MFGCTPEQKSDDVTTIDVNKEYALEEGKLSGQLKAIVQDMDEEENDLLFLLRFKKSN